MRFLALLALAAALYSQPLRKAPSFTLPDANRVLHDVTDHRGKVVIIELMRTDCPHCAGFTKILEQVQAQYKGRVQVFSIVNPPDSLEAVQKYTAANKVTFPILLDCGQASYSYVQAGSVSLPRFWVVDGAGMIRKDVAYTQENKAYFEGRALFTDIDKLLTPAPKK